MYFVHMLGHTNVWIVWVLDEVGLSFNYLVDLKDNLLYCI